MSQFNEQMNKKAVALSYDEDVNAAPVVVASGSGYIAQKIVETARNNGIPVYEDNSLATMLSQLELGSEIPEQLYQAIVEIYVYFLNFSPKKPPASANQAEAQSGAQGAQDAQEPQERPLREPEDQLDVQTYDGPVELPEELTRGPGITLG